MSGLKGQSIEFILVGGDLFILGRGWNRACIISLSAEERGFGVWIVEDAVLLWYH